MADLSVQPIGTQVKPVQGMSLGEIMNFVRGEQQYRAEKIGLTLEQQKEAEREKLQRFFSDPANFQKEGRIDIDALNREIPRIAPLTGGEVVKQYTELGKSQTAAIEAKQKLTQDQRSMIGSRMAVIGRAGVIDPRVYQKELEQLKQENPDNPDFVKLIDAYQNIWGQIQPGDNVPGIAIRGANTLLTPAQQVTAFEPTVGTAETGAKTFVTKTTPSVEGKGPSVSVEREPLVTKELTPGTQVYNPQTGQYEYVGAPAGGTAVAKPSAEKSALETSRGAVISKDLPEVIARASEAPARIAIFQNIKKLAPDAFTGPTAERRQAIASFAQMLGIDAYEMETASTDELLKNTNLLALAGGNTDAAREIARFANPNNKMTKEGIVRVTNQLISIEEMNMARARYMGPAQNNPAGYFQRKLDFDAIADPRLFLDLNDAEYKKMYDAMTPNEKKKFVFKAKKAKEMGVIP
jgi:hypothetical protein